MRTFQIMFYKYFSTYNLYCYFRRAIAVSIQLKIPHLTPIIIIPISIWIVCILFLFLQKYLKLQQTENAYMDFLYQYMALPDQTDYSRDFYLKNVRLSLQARVEMPWGKLIPEREFRHFVVPVRVNNETLDNSREVFYQELKERVIHLSMRDAILEVNHWCHEKVTYRPSDARTSSPLASVKTAYGRCGEESTFLVAALRSVGIPARQVYTPRWAHTDDNHAWVEAWADGKWYFLGACEPEPVLNLGWFNESASRGMLMHTKVFGHYDGPEEVMSETPCYTEINVIDHYAPTSKVTILVVDASGQPVKDATVEFKLYNYAEFYTVATKKTLQDGKASLTAGKGDMLVWVSKEGMTAIKKVSFQKDDEVRLVLNDKKLPSSLDLDMIPPPVSASLPVVTKEQRETNDLRLAQEDSIRKAYEQTMPVEAWRGNHQVIRQFLSESPNLEMAEMLLKVISQKDLRDIPLEVLKDNEVQHTDTSYIYTKYVLNPRVEDEWLTPYKHFFREKMHFIQSPQQLVEWCTKHITIDTQHNPQHLRMQPMSVYQNLKTDELGRNIFFVSVARSLGIPARINEVNGKLQYLQDNQWQDVVFGRHLKNKSSGYGRLLLHYNKVDYYDDPNYYIHFTLSKIENGRAQLLTYPEEATWKKDFCKGVELDEGDYMLTIGTRENIYHDKLTATDKSILSTTGRGYYILGIMAPNHEPTNHVLRDISLYRMDFEKWGRKMVFLLNSEEEMSRFNFSEFSSLPSNVVWGTDIDGRILAEIKEQMKLSSASLPLILICDSFNRVVFIQQGYTIGTGEHLLRVLRKL